MGRTSPPVRLIDRVARAWYGLPDPASGRVRSDAAAPWSMMGRGRGFGRVRRGLAGIVCAAALLAAGCEKKIFPLFPEQTPSLRAGEGLQEAKLRIVAKDYACDPKVIAIDRDGRAIKVVVTVAAVGKEHNFSIPDLYVRRTVPADQESIVEFVADRSGIFEYGCSRFPALWMNPLESRGKLAIK